MIQAEILRSLSELVSEGYVAEHPDVAMYYLWLANCYFAHDSSGFPFPATILRWAICSFCSQSSACHCTRRSADHLCARKLLVLKEVVGASGFEPPSSWSRIR